MTKTVNMRAIYLVYQEELNLGQDATVFSPVKTFNEVPAANKDINEPASGETIPFLALHMTTVSGDTHDEKVVPL